MIDTERHNVESTSIDKVKAELALIKLREVEIEDLTLQIEELKLGDTLKAQQYNDMPTGSRKCSNNDSNLLRIESLEKRIKKYKIANRRINNALNILDIDEMEIIQMICIDKVSVNKTSQELGRQRKTINLMKDKALAKLAYFYK